MTITKAREQLTALMAKTSTPILITSLRELDFTAKTCPTQEALLCRAWTIDELEGRFPAASAEVEQAFELNEARMVAGEEPLELDQVAMLLSAIKRLAA